MTKLTTYVTLPEAEQVCFPCDVRLERTGVKSPGQATFRCPVCGRKYSDRAQHPDRPAAAAAKLKRQRRKMREGSTECC